MPTKRRSTKVRQHRITPEALAAFEAGDRTGLRRALGLRPWQPSPLEADQDDAPGWTAGTAWAAYWPLARKHRLLLEEAMRSKSNRQR